MNIAVIFDQKVFSGGGFHQSINALKLVNNISKNNHKIFFYTTIYSNKKRLRKRR